MKEIILAYQGEMSLKGLNRATFESVLLKTMRRRLKSLGNFKIYKAQSTMYAEPAGDEDIDAAEERIGKIFGIAAISRAAVCPKDFAVIADTAKEYLSPWTAWRSPGSWAACCCRRIPTSRWTCTTRT